MIFRINKYNYKTKIIIKICKLTCNNQMFGLRIFNQTKFKNLKFEIELDGGINTETIKKVRNYPVDTCVSGTCVFKSENMKSTINILKLW